MSLPSQDLAQKIIDKLIADKLVLAEDAKQLLIKLSDGSMEGGDWRLAIEKAIDKTVQP